MVEKEDKNATLHVHLHNLQKLCGGYELSFHKLLPYLYSVLRH